MHGRPRKALTEEDQEASSLKAAKLRDLQSQFLHFHHNKIYTEEAIGISTKLLESNPDNYTGWNYRKLAVQYRLDQQSESGIDCESIQSIFDEELRVVENALRVNFKSYGAWHHRRWVLSKGHSSTDRELRLLGKFQTLDVRNFHAWNYRRFITDLKKIPDEEELQYTTDMIYDNFSNYSAWHNRRKFGDGDARSFQITNIMLEEMGSCIVQSESVGIRLKPFQIASQAFTHYNVLLSNILEKRGKGYDNKENVLGEEYDFVCNALFTDPDDQSGWFYYLWLLDQTLKREPVFLSSWPPHASHLYLSLDGCLKGRQSLSTLEYHSKSRTFPLVLYFSDAVEGVSSSTVTVEYQAADSLIWKPLSANNLVYSQAWLTYLKFPDEIHSLEAFPVEVTIGHTAGITSLSGMPCSQFCHLSFSVSVTSDDQKHFEVQTADRISREEGNFKALDTESQELNLAHSLSKLEITKWSMEIISNEIARCRELLSVANCKIGKLTLARLLMARNTLMSYGSPDDGTDANYEDILVLYQDLMKMDSAHTSYYEDEYSLVLLKQLTSNKVSLSKQCIQCEEPFSPSINSYLSVQLNGLSLSRVGSMEHLLWVQVLDLSHNKLRSIEGLETLQLLSCLKLSYNKLCSFLALEPLKMLKCLKVLDISHNEIGAHFIDTRRYLCASPLTHSVGSDWHFQKFVNGDVKLKDHWGAYLLFKDLNLIQLNIMGNAVVDDRLKAFLFKLMPEMKWLDGEKCHQCTIFGGVCAPSDIGVLCGRHRQCSPTNQGRLSDRKPFLF
ncbi:hypothetical protein OROGR_025025 [Orobanche gracilis]